MVLGAAWLVMRGVREIALAVLSRHSEPGSLLVCRVVQERAANGISIIRPRADPTPVDRQNSPRELVGRE
jgi:hypothetical protein